jgi:uncharacterized protein (DUF2147 family)
MRHHAFAAAVGVLTAAILAPCSPSQAATLDPTGYWYKPDAERESKIQVFKCGPGKTQLCAKIAWLKDPNDSKGRPLHDIRNEAPSMRDRPIVGLQIFSGLAPSEPGTWTGKIYNPEDGHTYSATLTVLSRKEIKLRGCKAWLLCGEKQWLRTSAPPPDVIEPTAPTEGGQQIEASATPPATPDAQPKVEASVTTPDVQPKVEAVAAADTPAPSARATAAAIPNDAAPLPPENVQAMAAPEAPVEQSSDVRPKPEAVAVQQVAAPTPAPVGYNGRSGYGFLNVSASPADTARLSGEDVSSMMVMTAPLATDTVAPAAVSHPATHAAQPVPLPDQKPVVKPKPIATAAVKPSPAPAPKPAPEVKPSEQAVPQEAAAEQVDPAAEGATTQSAEADAAMIEEPPLTRRQRRLLRRQQQQEGDLLPWLR